MKTISAVACLLAALGTAAAVMAPVARDATVAYNGMTCENNVPCNSIPMGLAPTVLSFKGNRDYERVLLGFDLPTSGLPRKCILHIPAAVDGARYNLTVSATDNDWDEATVTGANKDIAGFQVAAVEWPATSVDIKYACDESTRSKLSLWVDTVSGGVTFHSLQSGRADVFVLEYEL
ncbi:hypothetical protein IWQ57_003698 [Coemansia nantahalensis]|uniref:Uncharacterized protein n=1 Tax=Coemansia nantahalensis TaxID=2789366 RepID=A0ACC1JVE5_9FUNG|nr:hypothetical protein IWQ57_003698 [Coemansia nantahalensis]